MGCVRVLPGEICRFNCTPEKVSGRVACIIAQFRLKTLKSSIIKALFLHMLVTAARNPFADRAK